MSEFTRGPWVVLPNHGSNAVLHKDDAISICTNDGLLLDVCAVWSDIPFGSAVANANLIAAAPDLYEALQQAVTSMQDSGYSNNHMAVKSANLALAKARGEND